MLKYVSLYLLRTRTLSIITTKLYYSPRNLTLIQSYYSIPELKSSMTHCMFCFGLSWYWHFLKSLGQLSYRLSHSVDYLIVNSWMYSNMTRCCRFILCISCPRPGVSPFFSKPSVKTIFWTLESVIATHLSLLLELFNGQT